MADDDKSQPLLNRRKYLQGLTSTGALLWGGSEAASAHGGNDSDTGHKSDIDLEKSDLYYSSVATLAALIREEIVSPVDVVDAFLHRIKQKEEKVNAFIPDVADELVAPEYMIYDREIAEEMRGARTL